MYVSSIIQCNCWDGLWHDIIFGQFILYIYLFSRSLSILLFWGHATRTIATAIYGRTCVDLEGCLRT